MIICRTTKRKFNLSESHIALYNILRPHRKDSLECLNERQMTDIFSKINDTALDVVRYGMESTGICDLLATAAENLDLDWDNKDNESAIEEEMNRLEDNAWDNKDNESAIEEEMNRLEDNAQDAVNLITDAIDSVLPLNKLTRAQKQRLCFGLEGLSCYGAKATDNPCDYAKVIIATFALHDDISYMDDFRYALENAFGVYRKSP